MGILVAIIIPISLVTNLFIRSSNVNGLIVLLLTVCFELVALKLALTKVMLKK